MGVLHLALLGPLLIEHDGRPLPLPTQKTRALLVYLAVARGPHSRDELAALLWGDSAPVRAAASLRRALADLRAALGDDAAAHVDVGHELIGLRAAGRTLDLDAFEGAWQGAQLGEPAAVAALAQAITACRGELLAGFSLPDAQAFEDWCVVRRELWSQRLERACELLVGQAEQRGDAAAAIDAAERWLLLAPHSEAAYRGLMTAQLAAGQAAGALSSFDACRAMLARELGVEPDGETVALAEGIRAATATRERGPVVRPSLVAAPVLAEAPLVGRDEELRRLNAAFAGVVEGAPRLVSVEGEAGIGKTRLASEFIARAVGLGADLVRGRAYEMGGRLPYQPLVDGLRARLERENAPDDLVADVWLAELRRLLPELGDRYPDVPAPPAVDDEAARSRLFAAVGRLVQSLADRAPLVLYVDDLQWADAATRDLLRYVLHHANAERTRLLLLATVRAEDLESRVELMEWLDSAGREVECVRLPLGPLTLPSVETLVRGIAAPDGAAGANELAAVLHAETGGQPFFVVEAVKALVERGDLSLAPEAGLLDLSITAPPLLPQAVRSTLLPGVRGLVRSRLAGLDGAARSLLNAAAVLGLQADFDLLCEVAELDEAEALPSLERLIALRLLRERAAGPAAPTYLFTHDWLRDVVYADTVDARRRVLHRRAVAALERRLAPAATLAQHAAAAHLAGPTVRYGLAAGDEALRVFAVRDAAAYLEQARDALLAGPTGAGALELDWPERERLYLLLGRAYELLGDLPRARAVYSELLDAARAAGAARIECVALSRTAMLSAHEWLNLDGAIALLHEALAAAERSGDPLALAETEWHLAQVHFYHWDADESLRRSEHALALARELGNDDLVARALNASTYVLTLFRPRWDEGERRALEAQSIFARQGNRALEADSLTLVCHARTQLCRLQEAIAAGEEALAISRGIENVWGQLNASCHLVWALIEAGRYGDALRQALAGATLARQPGTWPPLVVLNLIALGGAYTALLDHEAAAAIHAEARAVSAASGWDHSVEFTAATICADHALQGEYGPAHAALQEAAAHRARCPYLMVVRSCLPELDTLLHTDGTAAGAARLEEFRAAAGDSPRYRLEYLRGLALLQQHDDDSVSAAAVLTLALELARTLRLPGRVLAVASQLAVVENAAGVGAGNAVAVARATAAELAASIDDSARRDRFLAAAGLAVAI